MKIVKAAIISDRPSECPTLLVLDKPEDLIELSIIKGGEITGGMIWFRECVVRECTVGKIIGELPPRLSCALVSGTILECMTLPSAYYANCVFDRCAMETKPV